MTTVIVIAKQPRPGHVKTRLVPPLTYAQAADLAGAALRDTLRAVGETGVLAFDGNVRGWLPPGWRYVRQATGGLDGRLAAAFRSVGQRPAVLVGMDTPQLRAEHLTAFEPHHYDACLGLASDGGYWSIGFADSRVASRAITGVPMSTDRTGAIQLRRLTALGMRVQLLDRLTDVDTIDTARQVADAFPHTAFAAALDDIRLGGIRAGV